MTVSTSNITKCPEIALASVTGSSLALASGTIIGLGVATTYLCKCQPHHAVGSFLYTLCIKQKAVIIVTQEEMQKVDYSLKRIALASMQ